MKRILVVLLTLAMALSLFAVLPFATSADSSAVWSGKANIQWYLDAIAADPDATEFHVKTAEDLAGLAYLVNAAISRVDEGKDVKTCYDGLWYDVATGDVRGFEPSGKETDYFFDYNAAGFYKPTVPGTFQNTGVYVPQFNADYTAAVDGSELIAGDNFLFKTVYLDNDIVLNTGNAANWATSKPANVWMPIGGGRCVGGENGTPVGFNGIFKGQGHSVSGVYYSNSTDSTKGKTTTGVGLFGYAGTEGVGVVIQDLTVKNSYIRSDSAIGAIIGQSSKGAEFYNCYVVDCILRGEVGNVGGIVGSDQGGSLIVERCGIRNIKLEALKVLGGFVGLMNFQAVSIVDSFVTGTAVAFTTSQQVPTTDDSGNKTTTTVVSGGWDAGVLIGRIANQSVAVSNVFANLPITLEDSDNTNQAYTDSVGAIYGALGKNFDKDTREWNEFSAPTLSIEAYYYVKAFTVSNESKIRPFDKATEVAEGQLKGLAPTRFLKGFDFADVWMTVENDYPTLRSEGKDTDAGDVGPVHEHTFGAWVEEVPASIGVEGVKGHYECTSCGKYFDADHNEITDLTIPAEHQYGDWIEEIPATCTTAGTKGHYHCPDCGKDFDEEHNVITNLTIPAGHTFGAWVNEVAATESTAGQKGHYHCSTCGKDFDKSNNEITDLVIPATGNTSSGGGCGGFILGIPFVGVAILGAAWVMRKKED